MSLRFAIVFLFLVLVVHSAAAACSGRYTYILTFDFNWSFETDRGFPNKDPLIEPAFLPLVCASHSSKYTMWEPGTILSLNMIDFVSDKDNNKKIQGELREAQENGKVLTFNATEEGTKSLGALSSVLRVDPSHSLISCASRIDPSPGWFVGISALEMCKGNSFRTDHDLIIVGWWGGLDEAEDYRGSKPIEPGQNPFKVRRRIDVAPFGYGTLFITRQNANKPIPSDPSEQDTPPRQNPPPFVPAAEAICVDAKTLRHLPPETLLFPTHRHAYVLCDPFDSCATPGHIVVYQGRPMMMKSYCQLESTCEKRLILVNSPRYSRAMRIDTATQYLKFTAFAARFSTLTEEHVLSLAVRMGL